MPNIQSYRELIVWQKAHDYVLFVYRVSRLFPKEEQYVLTPQVRRAGLSVASNIVEGFRRSSVNESIRAYNIAEGSLDEAQYQLLVAHELGYTDPVTFQDGEEKAATVGKLLYRWKQSQRVNKAASSPRHPR